MLKNKLTLLLVTATLTIGLGKAVAECGDSSCTWIGDTFNCVVERPDRNYDVCTSREPCRPMRCP